MSCGVLLHALNNEQIDYMLLALCNAFCIKRHLAVPVCLITNEGSLAWLRKSHGDLIERAFDQIILHDDDRPVGQRRFNDTRSTGQTDRWQNTTRADSYMLTPFDETLLIDVDYLILDDSLNLVWGTPHEVMLNRDLELLDHGPVPPSERWLEETGIQLCWATCVYFRKSPLAAMLFDLIKHVRANYDFYSLVYGYPVDLYRNDYAFSIAVHMLSGFTNCDDIATLPYPKLFTSFDRDELIDVPADDDLVFLLNRVEPWRFTVTRTIGVSVHAMNKYALVRQAGKLLDRYARQ
jgi:hypothetical protein